MLASTTSQVVFCAEPYAQHGRGAETADERAGERDERAPPGRRVRVAHRDVGAEERDERAAA